MLLQYLQQKLVIMNYLLKIEEQKENHDPLRGYGLDPELPGSKKRKL